jgi:hypothetical protein
MTITASIDVTMVDKSFLKRVKRANGQEAVFLELIFFETPNARNGGWMIKQDIGKEARESGLIRPIIGNAVDVAKLSANKPASEWE